MTELTKETLADIINKIEAAQTQGAINLKPTKLIVPPIYIDILMYQPPIRKARGVRGRRAALNRRPFTPLDRLFRSKK